MRTKPRPSIENTESTVNRMLSFIGQLICVNPPHPPDPLFPCLSFTVQRQNAYRTVFELGNLPVRVEDVVRQEVGGGFSEVEGDEDAARVDRWVGDMP